MINVIGFYMITRAPNASYGGGNNGDGPEDNWGCLGVVLVLVTILIAFLIAFG